MSTEKSNLRTRLTRAAAAMVSVGLLSPLALINSASADTAAPGTVTTATVLDASLNPVAGQTNVSPNGPLTGLVNGSTVRVNINAGPGNNGKFFGSEARLCRDMSPGQINNLAAFNPSDLGNCIDVPFNAQSDAFVEASAGPLNNTVTFDFRVGTGTLSVAHIGGPPNPRTITCSATSPCDLWTKQAVDTTIQSSGLSFVHYDLLYAGAPGTPTAVSATPASTQANVSWTAPTDTGNAALLEYEVVVTGGPGAGTFLVPAAQTSTTISGLSNFTAYNVTVAARNRAADGVTTFTSAPSTAAAVTPAPGGPTNVTGTPRDSAVDLTWTAPTGPAVDQYEITASPTSPAGSPIVQLGPAGAPAPTSHAFTGLTNGTVYTFTVRARYGTNFGSSSAASAPITPNGRFVTQTITVTRPQGTLVLTQICGARGAISGGTAPTFGGVADPLFGDYPYPEDVDGVGIANYPTNCGINLGIARLIKSGAGAGQFFKATGNIHQVTVADMRDTDPQWTVNGSMSAFNAGPGKTFSGSQLGWTPIKTSDTDPFTDSDGVQYDQTVTAGAVTPANSPNASGLSAGRVLGSAPTGAGLGVARLDADLELLIPVPKKSGTYTGILTITAV